MDTADMHVVEQQREQHSEPATSEPATSEPSASASSTNEAFASASPTSAGQNSTAAQDQNSTAASDQSSAAAQGQNSAVAQDQAGLGIDIVEIERMRTILGRCSSFTRRVFSPEERVYCESKANSAAHYATRFAAKEAVVKALGTGFRDGIGVRDIEVVRDKLGKPTAVLSGRAADIASEMGVRSLSISLSYTHKEAVACAMAITENALKASKKHKDPMDELAKQFKEARSMLDDL